MKRNSPKATKTVPPREFRKTMDFDRLAFKITKGILKSKTLTLVEDFRRVQNELNAFPNSYVFDQLKNASNTFRMLEKELKKRMKLLEKQKELMILNLSYLAQTTYVEGAPEKVIIDKDVVEEQEQREETWTTFFYSVTKTY